MGTKLQEAREAFARGEHVVWIQRTSNTVRKLPGRIVDVQRGVAEIRLDGETRTRKVRFGELEHDEAVKRRAKPIAKLGDVVSLPVQQAPLPTKDPPPQPPKVLTERPGSVDLLAHEVDALREIQRPIIERIAAMRDQLVHARGDAASRVDAIDADIRRLDEMLATLTGQPTLALAPAPEPEPEPEPTESGTCADAIDERLRQGPATFVEIAEHIDRCGPAVSRKAVQMALARGRVSGRYTITGTRGSYRYALVEPSR